MRTDEIMLNEGEVVHMKFSNRKPIDNMPIPKGFINFKVKQTSPNGATQVIGIRDDKSEKVVQHVTSKLSASAIAKYYNTGLVTDDERDIILQSKYHIHSV